MLNPLQERVARIVSSLPEADGFALAGGAALVVAGVIDRATRDLDFFGPSAGDVDRLAGALEQALIGAGLRVRRERESTGFVRLTVADEVDSTEVDLGVDARIRPAETGRLGPIVSMEELAADKLLALFDRAQARDFLDVAALVERLGLERMCQLAAEKDAGFSRDVLRDMLSSFGRFDAEELGLDEPAQHQLARSVQKWRDALAGGRKSNPERPDPDVGPSR